MWHSLLAIVYRKTDLQWRKAQSSAEGTHYLWHRPAVYSLLKSFKAHITFPADLG